MRAFNPYRKTIARLLEWGAALFLFPLLPYLAHAQKMTLSRQLVPKEISKKGVQDILEDRYGFIWFGGNGLYRYDGYHPRQYKPGSDDSTAVDFGTVYALLEDKQGRIWIGSSNGLFRYEREAGRIQSVYRDQLTNRFGKAARIMSLFEDSNGRVWIGSEDNLFVVSAGDSSVLQPVEGLDIDHSNWFREGGVRSILECDSGRLFAASTSGLWQVNSSLTLIRHIPDKFADGAIDFRIENAARGKGDTLWLATAEGLWAFDAGSSRFYKMVIPGYARQIVNALWVDKQNQVWIAVKDEIFTRSGEGTFRKLEGNTHYLFDGIRAITKGRQGNLWFGGNHGIGMLDLNQDQRLPFYQIGNGSPYHDNHFYRIVQDHSGGFWFRMYRSGLGYCPALDDEFEILLEPPVYYFGEEVKGICTDVDGNVWVITYTNGLFLFEKGHTAYRSIDLGDSLRRVAIPSAIIADNQDSRLLWFSSRAGLCSVDRFTLERKWYHPRDDLPWLDLDAIGMIGQADDGNIWCDLTARSKHIVGYFDRRKGRFFAEPNLPGRPEATWICQFKPVAEGEMWVATNRGMIVIDTRQKKQRFWTEENGFPTNDPLSITPDREGNIWFTGERTIYKYDGKGFDRYNANAAIDRFDNTSSALTREGMVAFGGVNGLHVFDPKKLEKDTIRPKVYLSGFRVFNKERDLGQAGELIREIVLTHSENVFTFEFAGLHFSHAGSLRYRHILEGFEKGWVETGSGERLATYTSLPPGEYTFRAMAANADGFWTAEEDWVSIKITILPPWYSTGWAYLLWAALIFGSIFWIYRFQLKRQLALAEARRLKKLDLAKSQLYTNITHEFRTPLAVILGMAGQMKSAPEKWFDDGLRLIQRNGKQLLNLVNQLLDLSKLEAGQIALKPEPGELASFLQYLTESFHSYADSKDIRLHFISDLTELHLYYDPERLQCVVSNLLSNAIKFTPAGGNVYVGLRLRSQAEKTVEIQIKDDGIGIAPEHLPYIFDRFYQVDGSTTRRGEGTGIGLALAQKLVQAMGGRIEVESRAGKGARFSIFLPITPAAGKPRPQPQRVYETPPALGDSILLQVEEQEAFPAISRRGKYQVLLVEDNEDVLTYLASFLSSDYQIVTARDGQEGIDKALELIPDLIVSDVMMPVKDGYELCAELKEHEETSHIPIILLTAKSGQNARIEGLAQGADAYLAKPFSQEELLVRIEKLIGLRRRLQERFRKAGALRQLLKEPTPAGEDAFLQKVFQVIENNLHDEHFGMPQLCKELHMSRSNLFRKLKALTGKSGTRLIRSMRLEKGKELLETAGLNVSEACFEAGFNNPSYFTRMFQKEFGVLPSEIRKL